MEEAMYNELLVELECPVCTNYMSPPIRQCSTGHSICEPCRRKLPKCPLCQGKFTDSKNISLEALARKMHYPCIHRTSGCTRKLTYENREEHEDNCVFRGFKCGMDKCGWVGQLHDVLAHWESKKMTSKPYHGNNVCHSKIKSDSVYVNIVKAHDQLFWFKCKMEKGKIFWIVQYIGKSEDADNYFYEVEIIRPAKPKRHITFSDYCQKIDKDNNELYANCPQIAFDCIYDYVGCDQLLIYYLRVNRVNKNANTDYTEGPAAQAAPKNTWKPRDHSAGPKQGHKHFRRNAPPNKKQNKEGDFVVL